MFERFTSQARAAVVEAAAAAEGTGSGRIGREHVLIGLAEAHEPTLTSAGFNAATLTAQLVAPFRWPEPNPMPKLWPRWGSNLEAVRSAVEEHFGPDAWQAAAGGVPAERGWITRLPAGSKRPVRQAPIDSRGAQDPGARPARGAGPLVSGDHGDASAAGAAARSRRSGHGTDREPVITCRAARAGDRRPACRLIGPARYCQSAAVAA